MPHTHTWVTVFSEGELEQQECTCGRMRDIIFDFQDGSTQITEYDKEEEE